MKQVIAVIPARGSSQRIPNKALQLIEGKSLLSRAIETLRLSNIVDSIIVSTDSRDIADEALRHGVEVPHLRESFADHYSPVSKATTYTLGQYRQTYSIQNNAVIVQVMPNCPFVSPATILDFVTRFGENPFMCSLLSCVKVDPINRFIFELNPQGEPSYMMEGVEFRKRTQDFSDLFTPSGAIWVSRMNTLISTSDFYAPGFRFKEIAFWEGFDIDTPDQLQLARMYAASIK